MQKRPLRLVSRRSAAATQKIDEMQPGDLLYRLAVLSPDDYRAFIALLRWRYKQLWPRDEDVLLLTGTRLR